MILLITFPLIVAKKKDNYTPNPTHFSYLNNFFAFNLALINSIHKTPLPPLKSYKIAKNGTQKKIVVLIIGESLNYKRMHLFGWDLNSLHTGIAWLSGMLAGYGLWWFILTVLIL